MSTHTEYLQPDGAQTTYCPRRVIDSDGVTRCPVTPETFASIAGCSLVEVADPDPVDPYTTWRDEHLSGIAAFRSRWDSTKAALIAAGHSVPDEITFRDLSALLLSLGGDWVAAGFALRLTYDEVIIAAGGHQQAYAYLDQILTDDTLVSA